VTAEQETRLRRSACQLVVAGGAMLNLPHDATLSAASFVLRFYAERSWAQFSDSLPIVSACLFLASKLEEVRGYLGRECNTLATLSVLRTCQSWTCSVRACLGKPLSVRSVL